MINSITFVALVATVASAKNQNTITLAPRDDTASAGSEVPAFGQCGGQSYTGLTNCGLGYQCVYQNEFYSQCIAIDYSREQYAQRWEQCHGINYNGPTDCVPGFTCSIQNDYFGGCRPGTATGLITSTTTEAIIGTNTIEQVDESTKTTEESTDESITSEASIDELTIVSNFSTEEPTITTDTLNEESITTADVTTEATSTSTPTDSTSISEFKLVPGGLSGMGKTTQYWDCCLPAFSWNGRSTKVPKGQTVRACDANGNVFTDTKLSSGCTGGNAFACTDQYAWAIDDNLAYGFGSISLMGATDETLVCSCYKLTFNETSIVGKQMIVQATNTGGGKNVNHFDLAVPGSGVGPFTGGCKNQFGSGYSWSKTSAGLTTVEQCDDLPSSLKSGCEFRFKWFQDANNPHVYFEQVVCPAEIIAKSGCYRTDQ